MVNIAFFPAYFVRHQTFNHCNNKYPLSNRWLLQCVIFTENFYILTDDLKRLFLKIQSKARGLLEKVYLV